MISEFIYLAIVHVLTEIKIIEQQKQMNTTSTWRINRKLRTLIHVQAIEVDHTF